MASTTEKQGAAQHVDTIEQASNSSAATPQNLDELVIKNLEEAGEEIGMTWRTIGATTAMIMCYNAYLFTLLIPPAILSYINADLGPDPRFTWITISWNLGGAIFVTIGGRLSDIFGRRWFFIGGSAMLIIASIVSATGKSINQMIAGGAMFGAGAGFLEMCFGAVQEVVPNKYRHVTVGVFDCSSIIAQIMPLCAWAMIKYTHTWRNAYYLMIGFQTLNLGIVYFFYHPPAFKTKHMDDGKSKMQLLREFDWVGLVLFIAGCTLFIVGVNSGGSLHPWKSAATIAPIVIGILLLVVLGFWSRYSNVPEPLLPPRLFKQVRQFTVPIICISIAGMQYYSNATLWPRLSQLLYASDEISKGLYSEVLPLGTIIGGFIVAASKQIGHQRWQIFGFIALQTACVGAMSTSTLDNPAKSIVLTAIISLCTGVSLLNSLILIGFGIINQDDIGTAAGLGGTARLLFGAVATAIFSNVTNNKYAASLPGQVRAGVAGLGFSEAGMAKLITAARTNTAAGYRAVPGITTTVQAAAALANKKAYLEGAHQSYLVALAFGLLGCIAALFIPTIDGRKYTNRTVAVQESDRKALAEKRKLGQA